MVAMVLTLAAVLYLRWWPIAVTMSISFVCRLVFLIDLVHMGVCGGPDLVMTLVAIAWLSLCIVTLFLGGHYLQAGSCKVICYHGDMTFQ